MQFEEDEARASDENPEFTGALSEEAEADDEFLVDDDMPIDDDAVADEDEEEEDDIAADL